MNKTSMWLIQHDYDSDTDDEREMSVNREGDLEIDLIGGQGTVVIKKEQFPELSQILHELMFAEDERRVKAKSFNNSVIITGDNNVVQK